MRRRRPRFITVVLLGVPALIAAYLLVLELVMAPIRTLPANEGCALMMADGTLHGDRWTSPYVWLDTTGFGVRFEVIWPHGYSARFLPRLELVDGTGRVVAREGDYVQVMGYGDPFESCVGPPMIIPRPSE